MYRENVQPGFFSWLEEPNAQEHLLVFFKLVAQEEPVNISLGLGNAEQWDWEAGFLGLLGRSLDLDGTG